MRAAAPSRNGKARREFLRRRRELGAQAPGGRPKLVDPKKRKTEGVEEIQHPDGSWERIFHGASMRDTLCRNALKEEAAASIQRHHDAERVKVQLVNDPAPVVIERERAELYEKQGQLRAVSATHFSGFGEGRPGCDGCGAQSGRLRYHLEHGKWLCAKGCSTGG